MNRLWLMGNWPHAGVVCIAVASLLIGRFLGLSGATNAATSTVVTADRGALILKYVLQNPEFTEQEQQERIVKPIQKVLKKYADQGNVVLDVSRDEQGLMMIAGMPEGVIDITQEMQAEIEKSIRHLSLPSAK